MAVPIAVQRQALELTHRRHWYERAASPWLQERTYERIKRAIDIAVALVLLPPAMLIVAFCVGAIALDSQGSPWLAQERTGRGGRRFRMFKLRTMVHNAAELKAKYMHLNEHTYPDFKITNDPRLTRCGRILRILSLDELPQLINVLRGDMTLVGPRPTSFTANTYRLWQTVRLEVTPGITGLWQVTGRDLDFDDRLRLDIAYIRHRCLWLDCRILIRTITAVIGARGAH
jgi:lipopolysaccharide/colanic/teichoic acid biosynthesis glycosyltransferase